MPVSTNNYVNGGDLQRILDEIPRLKIRKWSDHDIKFLFKIAYYCALRMGEACKVKKEDFDLETRYLQLGRTKSKRNDSTVIPTIFVEDLRVYLNYKDNGRLFPGLRPNTVRPWILKLGKWLEIDAWTTPQKDTGEKTKMHIFRKSRGKELLYNKEADINIIQKVLRHQSLNTTSVYLKASNEAVKDVI